MAVSLCLLDTSVLINFLAVDRVDLLATHPALRFLITPHVRNEVTAHYAVQVDRLLNALASGALEGTRVDAMEELALFAQIIEAEGFGPGEAAALAAAIHRKLPVAIQDGPARKRALKLSPGLTLITTEQIMLDHIRAGTLTLDAADAIKGDWQTLHRFKIKAKSFRELL